MLHFPPTGKKCPGPKHCSLSLEGEIKDLTEQQGGIDVDVDLLQESIQSTPKQQLTTDHLTRADSETSLRDRVLAVEEALEENNGHLNQILGLLKKKEEPCVNSSGEEDAAKPGQVSHTKVKTKKRSPSPSLSSSDESTGSTSLEKEKKKKDPAKKYPRRKFLEGEDKVKMGDDLLLVGVKTVERIIEDGDDPLARESI